jgi:hypothetical protein
MVWTVEQHTAAMKVIGCRGVVAVQEMGVVLRRGRRRRMTCRVEGGVLRRERGRDRDEQRSSWNRKRRRRGDRRRWRRRRGDRSRKRRRQHKRRWRRGDRRKRRE